MNTRSDLEVVEMLGSDRVFVRMIRTRVREYFKDETHRKNFEKWYKDRHGEDFRWEDSGLTV